MFSADFSGEEPAKAFSVCFRRSPALLVLLLSVLSFSCRSWLRLLIWVWVRPSPSRSIKLRFMPLLCPLAVSGGRSPSPWDIQRLEVRELLGLFLASSVCLSVCLSEVVQVGQVVQVLGLIMVAGELWLYTYG